VRGWFGVGERFVVVVCGVRLQRRLCLQVVCACCHGKKRYTYYFCLGGILFFFFVLGLFGLLVLGSLVYRSCVFVFVVLCAMCCVC
jgi:hypothetical protein